MIYYYLTHNTRIAVCIFMVSLSYATSSWIMGDNSWSYPEETNALNNADGDIEYQSLAATPISLTRISEKGITPVEAAFVFVWYGDTRRTDVLLEHLSAEDVDVPELRFGPIASVFTTDYSAPYWSLLHVAVIRNRPDIVRSLLNSNIDANLYGTFCPTPLELLLYRAPESFETVWNSNEEFVNMALLLLKHGAKVTSQEILLHGILRGNCILVDALLRAGADPNAIGASGSGPLHTAIQIHDISIVKKLLEYNADPTMTNFVGMSAYDLAVDDATILEVLEEAVVDRRLIIEPAAPSEKRGRSNKQLLDH